MADKKFLMLSLEDEATRRVANAVSNESCRKIIDVLSEKDATESEIAKKLGSPLSTIHYNLRQLVDVGLVSADEFHYSRKGKEVLHYKLANKYIIITPKEVTGIKGKLRKILPLTFIAGGAALIAQLVSDYLSLFNHQPMAQPFAVESAALRTAAMPVANSMMIQAPVYTPPTYGFEIALWFFLGSLLALGISSLITREK